MHSPGRPNVNYTNVVLTFVMLDVPDFVNGLMVCEEATGIMLAPVDGVPATFDQTNIA